MEIKSLKIEPPTSPFTNEQIQMFPSLAAKSGLKIRPVLLVTCRPG
jgi:hypothetical protein